MKQPPSWSRQQMHKPATPERDEQVKVFQILALNESQYPDLKWIHAIPNGGLRNRLVAIKLKAEGVKRGILDICVPIAAKGYHGLYIEMKAGKNKPTVEQLEFITFLQGQGYCAKICYTAREALEAIESYLGIKLRGMEGL